MNKPTIFDVDGTLIHTRMEYFYESVKKVLVELGGNFSTEKVDLFVRGSKHTSRDRIIVEEFGVDYKEFIELWRADCGRFNVAKKYKSVYPDAKPVLDELLTKGVRMAVVTDAHPHICYPQLGHFIGSGYFSEIISTQEVKNMRNKPAPDGLIECMRRMKLSDACYVGDSESDIVAAQRAGIESIWIDRREHTIDIKADRTIKTLYELL